MDSQYSIILSKSTSSVLLIVGSNSFMIVRISSVSSQVLPTNLIAISLYSSDLSRSCVIACKIACTIVCIVLPCLPLCGVHSSIWNSYRSASSIASLYSFVWSVSNVARSCSQFIGCPLFMLSGIYDMCATFVPWSIVSSLCCINTCSFRCSHC